MTDVEPQEKQVEEPQVEEQLEPSRIAGGCVALVLVGTAGGVVYAVPEVGYFVAGLLATGTVRKARGWLGGRRRDEDEQEQAVDILEQLRALADGGQHVLLTQLQKADGLGVGQAGTVVHDPAEAHRHQQVRTH
jgi:hypothetical protein